MYGNNKKAKLIYSNYEVLNYMTSSMKLTDKESFDNYVDYVDEIGCRLIKELDSDDFEVIDLAVVKEMHTLDLINYEFYLKQKENVRTIHKYRRNKPTRLCSLKTLIVVGIVFLLVYSVCNGINKADL